MSRAEDHRPVVADSKRKSLGVETTFARDLMAWEEVSPALDPVFAKLWVAYRRDALAARTVTVKVKYADFRLITRRRSCTEAITSAAALRQISFDLLLPLFPPPRGVRLLGVSLSNFDAVADLARQFALGLP